MKGSVGLSMLSFFEDTKVIDTLGLKLLDTKGLKLLDTQGPKLLVSFLRETGK